MGEPTRNKQNTTTKSETNQLKESGWIRMHSEEHKKLPPVDEPMEIDDQSSDSTTRQKREKAEREKPEEISPATA
jgi:hypothetical protein